MSPLVVQLAATVGDLVKIVGGVNVLPTRSLNESFAKLYRRKSLYVLVETRQGGVPATPPVSLNVEEHTVDAFNTTYNSTLKAAEDNLLLSSLFYSHKPRLALLLGLMELVIFVVIFMLSSVLWYVRDKKAWVSSCELCWDNTRSIQTQINLAANDVEQSEP